MLALPASSSHDHAVRWRQLVELAARAPPGGDHELIRQAIEAIRSGLPKVDERVRVAAALAIASLPLTADLVTIFASDRLAVAAPVLAGARLTASEWKAVAEAASHECRAFISAMRSEPAQAAAPPAPARDRDLHPPIPSISEVVARIERLRQSRGEDGLQPPSEETPTEPRLFRWECNESGEIDWVEGAPRGAFVGHSIAQHGAAGGVGPSVERAFASRAPFHDAVLELPGESTASGTWKISGVPAFERSTGRFAGYRGIAERTDKAGTGSAISADPASLRELAHEIRTPLNAIIGFAEIISGEYLGPAETRYRERAEEIVTQARILLTAIEDLDFAARVHSASTSPPKRIDLGDLAEAMAGDLHALADPRGVVIEFARGDGDLGIAFDPDLARRLILRMCGAIIECATQGETLRLTADDAPDGIRVSLSRPQAFADWGESDLFGPSDKVLPCGFSLRLARGLVNAAGAALSAADDKVSLIFPRN